MCPKADLNLKLPILDIIKKYTAGAVRTYPEGELPSQR